MVRVKIDLNLLPMKAQFFLWNADIPTEEIKRKLHTLRAQYSKETGKIRKMEHSSGRTYSSKWEHYDQLRFMFSHSEEWSTPDQRVAEYNSQSIDAEDVKPAMELTTNVIEVESYPSTSYSNLQDSQTSLAASSPISSPAPPYLTSVMKTKRKRIDELENFHTTCWEILSEKKNKDEFSIFGEFVASEMRQMSDRSDLVFRLKHKIQKVILEISEEYALSVFGNQRTAPVVPFLPTYARQLGFSSVIVGTVYTILPITGMLAKPLFGALADRYQCQKLLFIVFQVVTAITFFGIQFIPEIPLETPLQLSCDKGFLWLKSCVNRTLDDCSKSGDKHSRYGHQRLWGAVGWGVFSVISGLLVDEFSQGKSQKDYTAVFFLMAIMLFLDVLVSTRLKYSQTKLSASIFRDVGRIVGEPRIVVFIIWIITVGLCTGLVWQFLFWHLEDLAKNYGCGTSDWIKTLEGLVMGIQCFGGELPFFFLSGRILKKIGHIHTMTLVLLGIALRFILYSQLTNPWWCLPIELFQGITFGIFYATMASFASIVAPPGTEATVQGLVGALFEGVGVSLGSLLGGVLFDSYGGHTTFLVYGLGSLVMFVLHIIVQYYLSSKNSNISKEFDSPAHYTAPHEAIQILENDEPTMGS
ncbi:uncharacterized protein GBIM_13312 [Gryllus bimaculatus]|nr:uncharacterized protein GBIM_13312 [Gryllus bimaculatus]